MIKIKFGLNPANIGVQPMNKTRPLDTRQLQVFEKLCCTNSFTQTAKLLFVTQSAVSHSLKSLEEEVGCKLLEKTGKKLSLTQAGDRLLKFARPLLEEMTKVKEEIATGENCGPQKFRIGASDQICRFLLPDIISNLSEGESALRLEVHGLETMDCLNLLSAGDIDLALTVEPIQRNEYSFVPCFSDEIVIVVYPDHPWATAGKIPWQESNKEKFIFPNTRGYTFRKVEKFLKENHYSLTSFIELNSVETMKEMISRRMGVGIMSDWSVLDEVESGRLVALPFGAKRLIRPWGVSFLKGRTIGQKEQKFIKCVERLGCKWTVNRKPSKMPVLFG